MRQSTLLTNLRAALAMIPDIHGTNNIVAAGRIADLSVSPDGKARLVLDGGDDDPQAIAALLAKAEAAAAGVEGICTVQVIATRHSASADTPRGGHHNPLGVAPRKRTKPQTIAASKTAFANIGTVLAIASGKGGVGKSTLTVNLAMALAARGLKVGILDCDVYGPSLPILLGLTQKPPMIDGKIEPARAHGLTVMSIGLLVDPEKALAWRGPMVMGAVRQLINDVNWGALDMLLIDTPPGTGDAHLTLIQTGQLDGAIIVTTPQEMALADVRRGIALFHQTKIPVLGLIENMAWFELPDGTRQYIFGEGGGLRTAAALKIPYLGAIALDPQIAAASDSGTPFIGASITSAAATAITEIANKIIAPAKGSG